MGLGRNEVHQGNLYQGVEKVHLEFFNTLIWTLEGGLYLAAVKNLYKKEIVGYCLSERMTKEIVIRALKAAILKNKHELCLIFILIKAASTVATSIGKFPIFMECNFLSDC